MASPNEEFEGEGEEEDKGLVGDSADSESKSESHPGFYFISESILIVGGIPTIILFVTGIINGFLLLVEDRDYLI